MKGQFIFKQSIASKIWCILPVEPGHCSSDMIISVKMKIHFLCMYSHYRTAAEQWTAPPVVNNDIHISYIYISDDVYELQTSNSFW